MRLHDIIKSTAPGAVSEYLKANHSLSSNQLENCLELFERLTESAPLDETDKTLHVDLLKEGVEVSYSKTNKPTQRHGIEYAEHVLLVSMRVKENALCLLTEAGYVAEILLALMEEANAPVFEGALELEGKQCLTVAEVLESMDEKYE